MYKIDGITIIIVSAKLKISLSNAASKPETTIKTKNKTRRAIKETPEL